MKFFNGCARMSGFVGCHSNNWVLGIGTIVIIMQIRFG